MKYAVAIIKCSTTDIPFRIMASREEALEYVNGIDDEGLKTLLDYNSFITGEDISDMEGIDVAMYSDEGEKGDVTRVLNLYS